MQSDAEIMVMVRAAVAGGLTIHDALLLLNITEKQSKRVLQLAEQELGLEVKVGPGIKAGPSSDWLLDRDLEWFHWDRLKSLLASEGKLPIGAVRMLDKVSRVLLQNTPRPDSEEEFRWMGMVVGNVQSGKTAAFTALISKAADAGYQLFIVLSGMLNTLRLQTQLRLSKEVLGKRSLGGIEMPVGRKWHPLTQDLLDGDWGTPGGMGVDLLQKGQTPSLAVVKKNVLVMARFNDWLESIALRYPALIEHLPVMVIDDESDEASIDTSSGTDPSSTNRELRRLLEIFKKRVYLGFTATPYANCFIPGDKRHRDWGDDLYPGDFILPLRTSESYTGSEMAFGRDSVWGADPIDPLPGIFQEIPEDEATLLVPSRGEHAVFRPTMTRAFRRAILSFFSGRCRTKSPGQG